MHEGSDSEPENADLGSWTRSGGPLMRTSSANKFINFVQSLGGEVENDEYLDSIKDIAAASSSGSIVFSKGDLLQPERIPNGFAFSVVRKEDLAAADRSNESGGDSSLCPAAECLQIENFNPDAASDSEEDDGGTVSLIA